ncbi:MAG TPA: amidohydrolase family protein [Gemmatimonadales bacterium]|nr:amidohydrolase family protein [Gemmatimonadales bacterium]
MIPARSRLLAAGVFILMLGCRAAAPNGLALVGATLIDGTGGPPLANAAIVIRDGLIESVGPRAGFELPKQTAEIDVSGRWIIPGLIDAHSHLAPAAGWAPARYLAWGVTTVRDLHGSLVTVLGIRKRANHGPIAQPRVYAAGAMIDGRPATYPDAIAVSTENDARKAVDRLVSAGADLINVYTRVDGPLLRAIVDEARAFNLTVTGHLGMTDALTAARNGISAIEHLSGVAEAASRDPSALFAAHYRGFLPGWTASERSWADLDSAALDRVATRLNEQKVTLIPTLVLHETLSRLNDPALLRNPALADAPATVQRDWDAAGFIARAGWTDADFDSFRRARTKQDLFLRIFSAGGGRIATGTDASNRMLVPGYSEHQELELLVRAGLSPREALRAATRNGAVLLGVDSIGLLAPGKVADLVVLSKDPLADIRNTRAIQSVMIRGKLLNADSIRAGWQQ